MLLDGLAVDNWSRAQGYCLSSDHSMVCATDIGDPVAVPLGRERCRQAMFGLAAAKSANAALRVVERWGLLSTQALAPGYRSPHNKNAKMSKPEGQSEPTSWILKHGENLRRAFAFKSAVAHKDWPQAIRKLVDVDNNLVRGRPNLGYAEISFEAALPHPGDSGTFGGDIPDGTDLDAKLRDALGEAVAEMISLNTDLLSETRPSGPPVGVTFDGGRFTPGTSVTLLQGIYLAAVEELAGTGQVATCEFCGASFRQTDRRQRFCPPLQSGQSACGNAQRQSRHRERLRAGG